MINFAEKIDLILQEKKISTYKMCKDTGISQQTYVNWKKGTVPAIDKAIRILKYLEVSADEFFEINPINNLNENEQELLKYFNLLPEREQIKTIGIMEDKAQKYMTPKSSDCKTG